MWEILDSKTNILVQHIETKKLAIHIALEELNTDNAPVFIAKDDGEIVHLIYCDVVYKPMGKQTK